MICATEFQKLIAQRNETVSEEYQMVFRIGLNMGEVIVEGTNLYGDGVNVAARRKHFASPVEFLYRKLSMSSSQRK